MREGAELVTSLRAKNINLNYIVKKLEACCDKYSGVWDSCPDLKECVEAFDERCSQGEIICRACGERVVKNKYCSNCGELLVTGKKKNL